MRRTRLDHGFVLIELLAVAAVLIGLAAAIYTVVHQNMLTKKCANNLRNIYAALENFEVDRGTLPRAAFYPDDPKQDNDSLLVVLQPYRIQPDIYICPSAPRVQKDTGLTYVWNVHLNGRKLQGSGAPAWMIVELNALSDAVPAPHFGSYNILYADGSVRRSKEPPTGLRGE
jgi:prepilin-type processing-associated H-X9-DG protein